MLDYVNVKIIGMTCNSCVHSIEQKLSEVGGVYSIKVSLADETAEIEYNKDLISKAQIIEKIDAMGFEASIAEDKVTFSRSSFWVKGMKNDSCVHSIETKLLSCPGVKSIKASSSEGLVHIIHNEESLSINEISDLICKLGFSSSFVSVDSLNISFAQISVEGMTCHSCVNNIEDFVSKKTGVTKISVSLKKELASIWFDPSQTNIDELRTTIDDMGFDASVKEVFESRNVHKSIFIIQTLGMSQWTEDDEDTVFKNSGIVSIQPLPKFSSIIIYYLPDVIDVKGIIDVVQSLGFACEESNMDLLDQSEHTGISTKTKSIKVNLFLKRFLPRFY